MIELSYFSLAESPKFYNFSTALIFALRAIELASISFAEGLRTFGVKIRTEAFWRQTQIGKFLGQAHPLANLLKCCLTMRSSKE